VIGEDAEYSSILEDRAGAISRCLKIKGVRVNMQYCILTLIPFLSATYAYLGSWNVNSASGDGTILPQGMPAASENVYFLPIAGPV
jgi:hypothetical protein